MTTTTPGLKALLEELGLEVPIPQFAAASVLNRPLDIGRSYFAHILTSIVKCDPEIAYSSLRRPHAIHDGDLTAILPKLGHPVLEYVVKLAENVGLTYSLHEPFVTQ